MTYMSTFCFYFSVRLGAIVTSICGILQNVVPLFILRYFGPEKLREVAHDYQMHVNEYHREMYFESFVEYLAKHSDTFIRGTIIYVSIYAATAFIEMVGAYRLNKWLLLPFIIMEALRLIFLFTALCIVLIVLKKKINLGILIGFSVAGAFVLLFLIYVWYTVVSLFQIIIIVNSSVYKALYGNDPLAKQTKRRNVDTAKLGWPQDNIKNVNFFPRTDFHSLKKPLKPRALKLKQTTLSMAGSPTEHMNNSNLLRNDYYPNNRSYGYF